MAILIDGYNLMHAAGILGGGAGQGGLHQSRLALLNFIAETVPQAEIPQTTVVFDASRTPRGLPQRLTHRGLTVIFATAYPHADDLIEELIRADHAPRRLTVVSSDHRLQRAARRRRAKAVDSDRWCEEMARRRAIFQPTEHETPVKPPVPASSEVEFWLNQFDADEIASDDIFPPGYGEDLEE